MGGDSNFKTLFGVFLALGNKLLESSMHSWRFLMCLGKSLESGKESRLSVRLEQLEDSGRFGGGICLPTGVSQHV